MITTARRSRHCVDAERACSRVDRLGYPADAGFTLVELMTVVAIFGVLTTLAVASLGNFSWNQRLNTVARGVLATTSRARAEALRRGQRTMVQFILASDAADATEISVVAFDDVNGDYIFDETTDELIDQYYINQFLLSTYLTLGVPATTYAEQLVIDDGGTLVRRAPGGAPIPGSILFDHRGFSYRLGATSGEEILNSVRIEISDPEHVDSGNPDTTRARVLEVTVAGAARIRVQETPIS